MYHDLLTAGQIPDPFYRDNENEALKIMDNDFVYSRDFQVPDQLLSSQQVLLHCDGLDTLATIAVNQWVCSTSTSRIRAVSMPRREMSRQMPASGRRGPQSQPNI